MPNQTIPLRFRRASTPTFGWNNLVMLAAALLFGVIPFMGR
jgi:hypothetical protein